MSSISDLRGNLKRVLDEKLDVQFLLSVRDADGVKYDTDYIEFSCPVLNLTRATIADIEGLVIDYAEMEGLDYDDEDNTGDFLILRFLPNTDVNLDSETKSMNKNSMKKCWRQIDEATEAIERLIDNGVLSNNHYDTIGTLASLKQDLEIMMEDE